MQSSDTVDRITEVTTADSGSLSVNLNFGSSKISEKAPIGVTKIEIDINGWKVLFVAAEGSGLIEGVPVGSATLKARGLDSGGTELYKASASINIIAGEVAIVNLMFEPNISFVARTGSTSGPDIVNGSAANPTIGTAYQVEQNVLDTRTFYIVNNGGIPVSYPVDPASVSNTDYFNIGVQPSAAGTLNPGDSFSFTVQFNSTDSLPNSYATEVDIQIDNGSFIFDISVVLTSPVLGPEMEVRFDTDTGTVVAFSSTPDQSDGTIMLQYDTASHIEHTFFIKNIGSQDLIVSGSPVIVLGGNESSFFAQTPPVPTTIVPGNSVSFTISFQDLADLPTFNPYAASITIASNAPGSPHVINLEGWKTEFIGTSGNDTGTALSGTPYDDMIMGFVGFDELYGMDGDDQLFGGADDDILEGGIGRDKLDGGIGTDTLTGGSGNDYFFMESPGDSIDDITDFVSGQDKIVLQPGNFSSFASNQIPLNAVELGSGSSTPSGPDKNLFYLTDNSTYWELWYDADGEWTTTTSDQYNLFDFTTNPGGFSAADIYVIDGPTFWGYAYFP